MIGRLDGGQHREKQVEQDIRIGIETPVVIDQTKNSGRPTDHDDEKDGR
jgi:hypothetical protein